MKVEMISKHSEALPVDIAVIEAQNFADAVAQVIKLSEDLRLGLVVWSGAASIVPENIREALASPIERVGSTLTREIRTKIEFEKDGLALSEIDMHSVLSDHFEQANEFALRGVDIVFAKDQLDSHSEYTSDFLSAFNSVAPIARFSRLDRIQKTSAQAVLHRDRLYSPHDCRIIRNVKGAGTLFFEDANVAGMGYGGAVGLKNWRNATAWMLGEMDVAFMLPTKAGGIVHTWPATILDTQYFANMGKRHFETMDVSLKEPIFPARAL